MAPVKEELRWFGDLQPKPLNATARRDLEEVIMRDRGSPRLTLDKQSRMNCAVGSSLYLCLWVELFFNLFEFNF